MIRFARLALCMILPGVALAVGPSPDLIPPLPITPLGVAASATEGGVVTLTWTNQADTDTLRFVVRYATYYVVSVSSNWFAGRDGAVYEYPQAWSSVAAGAANSQQVRGLSEGATYYIAVSAQDTNNNLSTGVAVMGFISGNVAPAVVNLTSLPGDANNEQGITLTWTAVGDDGNLGTASLYTLVYGTFAPSLPNNTTSLTVLVSTNQAGSTKPALPRSAGSAESYIVRSLTVGTNYFFQIKTADEAGNFSYSNVTSGFPRPDTTPPSAISQLSPSVNPLSWTEDPNGTRFLDVPTVLGALTCTGITQLTTLLGGPVDNLVSLTWTAPADQNGAGQLIPRYVVNWAPLSFPPLLAASELNGITTAAPEIVASTWTASRITAVVTGLTRRNPYFFTVRPKDGAGNVGSYVIVKSFTPQDGLAPAAITGISALPQAGGGAVKLTWVAPGDDGVSTGPAVASYAIEYATYPPASGLQADVTTWWGNSQGSAAPWVTNRFLPVPRAPGQIETHVVTGLGNPTTIYYFVIGSSDNAGNFSALTLSSAAAGGTVSADLTSPAAVTNLAGLRDPLVKSAVNLSWTAPGDPSSEVFAYAVKWATATSSDTTGWWTGAIGTITVVEVGLATVSAPGVTENRQLTGVPTGPVYVMIRSSDASNNVSSFSNLLAVAGFADTTPPSQIGDLKVSSVSLTAVSTLWSIGANSPAVGKVELTWTAPGDDGTVGAVAAVLLRFSSTTIVTQADWNAARPSTAEDPAGFLGSVNAPSVLSPGSAQSFVVSTGLTVGTTYYFAVRGQDVAGNLGAISTGTLTWCTPSQVVPITYLVTLDTNGVSSHLNEYYAIAPASITSVLSATSGIAADGSGRSIQIVRLPGDHNESSFLGTPNPAMGTRFTGVAGKVTHYNGQMQLRDVYEYQGATFPFPAFSLPAPIEKTAVQLPRMSTQATQDVTLPEATEHALVALRRVSLVNIATNTWPVDTSGVNVQLQDSAGGQVTVRFDAGTNMSGTIAPDLNARFDVIGTQGQFDTSSPYFGGYQIFPPSATLTGKGIGIIERPRGLTALPGNLAVTLAWTAVTDPNRNGFKIYSSTAFPNPTWTSLIDTPTAGLTAITVTSGLTAGSTYYFYVSMKQALTNNWQLGASANGAFQESGPPLADGLTLGATANDAAWVFFNTATDVTAPSGITNLVVAPGASIDGAIDLTWTAPGNDGASGTATKYLIRYATWPRTSGSGNIDNMQGWWDGALAPPANVRPVETYPNPPAPLAAGVTQQATLSGLLAGATYYIVIRAVDQAGNIGTFSNYVTSAPASDLAPPAPTGVVIVTTDKSLNITWQAPLASGVGPFGEALLPRDVPDYGYRIYYNPTRSGGGVVTGGQGIGAYDFIVDTATMKTGFTKTGLTRSYVIGGLQNTVPAYFVVATVDAKGNLGCTTEQTGTPRAPANVKISEVMLFGPNDQPGTVTSPAHDQFIELYNASDAPADITRWYVMSRSFSGTLNNNYVKAYIPPTILGPRQHFVVAWTQNTGLYRAGTRAGIVYPVADCDWGDMETWDAANVKQSGVWPAGQGPGKTSPSSNAKISAGSSISLLTPAADAALVKTAPGTWSIGADAMKNQPVADRISLRTTAATDHVFFNVNSDALPGGVNWPDGNGKYLDTETNSPPGIGPLFETRPSSWTVSFQRANEDVDNDRLDDWTIGLANPGASRDAAPPAAIQDLRATGIPRVDGTDAGAFVDGVDGGLVLTFTAPGDDAMAPGNYGRAFAYLVNYSTWYPTAGEEASWLTVSKTYVDAAPRSFTLGGVNYTAPSWEPLTPGSLERRRVGGAGFVAGVRYTFLVRGIDDVGNVFAANSSMFTPSSVGYLRINPALVGVFLKPSDIGKSSRFTRVNLATKKLEYTPGHLVNTGNPDLGQPDTLVMSSGAFSYNPYTPAQNTVTVSLKKDGFAINVATVVGGVKVGGVPVTSSGNSFTVTVNSDGSLPVITLGDRSGLKLGDAVSVPDEIMLVTAEGVSVTRYNDASSPSKPGDVENTAKPVVDSGAGTIAGSKGTVEPFGTVIFYGQNPAGKTRAELANLEIKASAIRANGAPFAAFASTTSDTNGGFPATSVGSKASTVYVVVKDAAGNLSPAFPAPFLPTETKLDAFGPNPFKPSRYQGDYNITETPRETFYFNLKEDANVNLLIFNQDGELVRTLLDNQAFNAGYGRAYDANGALITKDTPRPDPSAVNPTVQAVSWDGKNEAGTRVASGVYLLRFETGGVKTTKKLLVIQ